MLLRCRATEPPYINRSAAPILHLELERGRFVLMRSRFTVDVSQSVVTPKFEDRAMETEWYNRTEKIQQRVDQLRGSL